jgi:hypothetical protein
VRFLPLDVRKFTRISSELGWAVPAAGMVRTCVGCRAVVENASIIARLELVPDFDASRLLNPYPTNVVYIYIYGAPCKARNFNVYIYIYIYIWTYVWQL